MKVAAIPAQNQRVDENEDRARTGTQAHRDDRGQAALPAAGTGKLVGFRSVRMPAMRVVNMIGTGGVAMMVMLVIMCVMM